MLKSWNRKSVCCKEMKTREDIIGWVKNILPDPFAYKGNTGAAYEEEIRQFEYASRPLWAVFSLLASGDYEESMISPYIERIKAGLKPGTELSFPIPTTGTRQIAVEMAVYGYGLLSCQDKLLKYFNEEEIIRFVKWLNTINEIEFPEGNWYFFLIIVNCGLMKNSFPYNKERLLYALEKVESFYLGEGWYQDGPGLQRDYYIPFAFHFYSLLLKRYCPEAGLKEVEKRSLEFEKDFRYWIDKQGRTIPYGRSLTYRFAHCSYWSAWVLSGVSSSGLSESNIEVLKNRILGNLNYWADQKIYENGMLSIGYGYPNLIMSEDYNAPGSPMWAFKAFVILALPGSHKFWQAHMAETENLELIHKEEHPGFLITTGERHYYALSGLQYSKAKIIHHMSKYGKFCYSTAFGFNVSRDVQGINNFAADNVLALSVKGTKQYISRGEIVACRLYNTYIYSKWNFNTIAEIESWLIPVDEDFHIRIHRINSTMELETYEGAFPVFSWNPKYDVPVSGTEGLYLQKEGMFSGIVDLLGNRSYETILQNPNTNIYSCERNAVPALKGEAAVGKTLFGCVVYGNPAWNEEMRTIKAELKEGYIDTGEKLIYLEEL